MSMSHPATSCFVAILPILNFLVSENDDIEKKIDNEVKDIGKNLEIKNVIKLQAMVNNEMINVYNIPFYKEKLLYTDQLNIFDKPIYQNVTLGSYILNDPIVKSKINIIRIKKEKQKLLNEIEALKNG